MNIRNFTPFPAEITVPTDPRGGTHYLVVVKGTFAIPPSGPPVPASAPVPFFFADQHYGDPETTSIRYESEFALSKPQADIVLVGSAHAPGGRKVKSLVVEMRVEEVHKRIRVVGDRTWRSVLGLWAAPSAPRPFTQMPITYDRAFGGSDTSHKNPKRHVYERMNLNGVGLLRSRNARRARGKPLPNLEPANQRLKRPGARIQPAAFGFLGRSWKSRADFAGTYDQRWLDERMPLLPEDFDERYHQGAPADQTRAYLRGGERVDLTNLSPEGHLSFHLPDLALPMTFLFEHGVEAVGPVADTLILEPDERRFQILWRASRPVRGKLLDLGEVMIGTPPPGLLRARQKGKRYLELRSP